MDNIVTCKWERHRVLILCMTAHCCATCSDTQSLYSKVTVQVCLKDSIIPSTTVEIIVTPTYDPCLPVGSSQGASPARQPPAAGKPSGATVCGSDPGSQRYGGLVQEFFRNVCSSRGQGGVPLPVERAQRDSLGSLRGVGVVGVFGGLDEPKPECVPAGVLAGLGGSNDNVTRIVNKRLIRQTAGEEMVSIMGGGKETEVRPSEVLFKSYILK